MLVPWTKNYLANKKGTPAVELRLFPPFLVARMIEQAIWRCSMCSVVGKAQNGRGAIGRAKKAARNHWLHKHGKNDQTRKVFEMDIISHPGIKVFDDDE